MITHKLENIKYIGSDFTRVKTYFNHVYQGDTLYLKPDSLTIEDFNDEVISNLEHIKKYNMYGNDK